MVATGYEKDIDLPGPRPRTRGILTDAARLIPNSELNAAGVDRMPAGVTWLPWGAVVLTSEEANCTVVYEKEARDLPAVVYQPAFLVYDSLQCGTLSGMMNELWDRLAVNFRVGLSAALATQLATAAQGGIGLIGNATYVPGGGATSSLRVAINSAENYLASKLLDSIGLIHLTPGLLALAVADYLVEWDGSVYRTATGTIVVGDAGHTGIVTPQGMAIGTAAAPWIFATGDVWYSVREIPKRMEAETGEGYTLIRKNLERPLAELFGLVAFDPNVLAAFKVTVA